MDRDIFIITVYCLVVTHYRALTITQALRHGGFTPELTDEEVITMEICGEYWKLNTDADLYDYFRSHYQHFFPSCARAACLCAKRPTSGNSRRACSNA